MSGPEREKEGFGKKGGNFWDARRFRTEEESEGHPWEGTKTFSTLKKEEKEKSQQQPGRGKKKIGAGGKRDGGGLWTTRKRKNKAEIGGERGQTTPETKGKGLMCVEGGRKLRGHRKIEAGRSDFSLVQKRKSNHV